jgi:hypothetical protein
MRDSIWGSTDYAIWPFTYGIAYWNETMAILDPSLEPDTLLSHGQFVAMVADSMIYYQGSPSLASYYCCGLTSMPSMTIDDNNNMFLVWTCPTFVADPNSYMLRHIFERTAKIDHGTNIYWADTIIDLNNDFIMYNFSECI